MGGLSAVFAPSSRDESSEESTESGTVPPVLLHILDQSSISLSEMLMKKKSRPEPMALTGAFSLWSCRDRTRS